MRCLSLNLFFALVLWEGLIATGASAARFELNAALAGAAPGDTIRVPKGTYAGPIVIDRRLTVIGEDGAVIDGKGCERVVTIKAAGAVFRGFAVRSSGDDLERDEAGIWVAAPNVTVEGNTLSDVLFGICIHQAAGCTVRGNHISGKTSLEIARRGDGIRLWYSPDCVLDSNEVHDVRDVVIWFSKHVRLAYNHVTASRYGLHFMYCDDNTLDRNRLEGNSVGCYLMNSRKLTLHGNVLADNRGPSGYGIGLKDMDGIDATDNRIVGNRIGVYIDSSPQSVDVFDYFTRNLIACNDVGVALLPSVQRNVFSENTFAENQEQVAILGSGELHDNAFSVNGRGNFWSDYRGFDLKGSGVGDLPYHCQSLFENLMDREPKLRFFLYSPSQQAVEMASQAFPAVRPRAKLTDGAPLMRPVELLVPAAVPQTSWQSVAVGGVLLIVLSGLPILGRNRLTAVVSRPRPRTKAARPRTFSLSAASPEIEIGPAVLEVEGLTKRFGKFTAVDGLTFQLHRGQALALWGTNGAGKTTAIRCIMGLVHCGGSVKVADRDLRRRGGKALRGMIGYVAQECGFQGDLSVLETMRLYARVKGAPCDRVMPLLQQVGLSGHESKKAANLSGGMRKRLALAAALLNDPPLLVLDEIAANLDALARQSFLSLLAVLKRQGKTILFTSHRQDEVEMLADRVLVLEGGHLRHDCTPDRLNSVLGLHVDVRLALPADLVDSALGILRTDGFVARPHACGICVHLAAGREATAIHALARHGIIVDGVGIETSDGEQSHA